VEVGGSSPLTSTTQGAVLLAISLMQSSDSMSGPEAVVPETERRERRRALGIAIVVLLVAGGAGAAAGFAGGRSRPPGPSARSATSPEIQAFISRAQRGMSGLFVAKYAVTEFRGARVTIIAAQESTSEFSFESIPSSIRPNSIETEAFEDPRGPRVVKGHYLYGCERATRTSAWSCSDEAGIGMGGEFVLLEDYPPRSLVLALQNAVFSYMPPTPPGGPKQVKPERAYLASHEFDGHRESCLDFGSTIRPVATVCLNAIDVITSYYIPLSASISTSIVSARLVSYVRTVPNRLLELPVDPATGFGP
jgi:hypothetical protein